MCISLYNRLVWALIGEIYESMIFFPMSVSHKMNCVGVYFSFLKWQGVAGSMPGAGNALGRGGGGGRPFVLPLDPFES